MARKVRLLIGTGVRLALALTLAVTAGAIGAVVAASPQSTAARPGDDVLTALLAEVRGLRAALEQISSAGPRIQLSVARLQLEEQRIATMNRRLESVRDSLANAQREAQEFRSRYEQVEAELSGNPSPAERDNFTVALTNFKLQLADRDRQIQRYTAEDAELSQQIALEQGRWTEISQRLDDLERTLSKK